MFPWSRDCFYTDDLLYSIILNVFLLVLNSAVTCKLLFPMFFMICYLLLGACFIVFHFLSSLNINEICLENQHKCMVIFKKKWLFSDFFRRYPGIVMLHFDKLKRFSKKDWFLNSAWRETFLTMFWTWKKRVQLVRGFSGQPRGGR